MITFNGIPLASVAPVRVDDIAVSSVRLTVQARQRPVRFGADYVRTTGGTRTVTVTFALLTNDRTHRQEQLRQLAAWADIGKIHKLTMSDFPDVYLECLCREYPSPTVKTWWDGRLRMVFETQENPYFTSITEHTAACGTAFHVLGDAPDGPLMQIEGTVGAGAVTYSDGENSMTFAAYSGRPTGDLVIDLNCQTAAVGGVSIMRGYTLDSTFILPQAGTHTITGSGTVRWRERWL